MRPDAIASVTWPQYSPSSTSIEIADHEAAFWLAKDGALDFDFEVGVRLVFCLVLIYQKLLKLEFHLDPWQVWYLGPTRSSAVQVVRDFIDRARSLEMDMTWAEYVERAPSGRALDQYGWIWVQQFDVCTDKA